MNKAIKFRIYPNKEQEAQLAKTFGCCRFLYNIMLEDKIREYKKNKKMLKNTPARYKKEYPWLKEVDSLALANVLQKSRKETCQRAENWQTIRMQQSISVKREEEYYVRDRTGNMSVTGQKPWEPRG